MVPVLVLVEQVANHWHTVGMLASLVEIRQHKLHLAMPHRYSEDLDWS